MNFISRGNTTKNISSLVGLIQHNEFKKDVIQASNLVRLGPN